MQPTTPDRDPDYLPPDYSPFPTELHCPHCGRTQPVVSSRVARGRAAPTGEYLDATEVYRLACGHTVI